MLHKVKIPNNEGDINNMRKFILGLSFLGFGDIGFLIVFTYTLFHQSIINGSEGWLINLIANDTLIPVVFFSLWIITGIIICIRSLREAGIAEKATNTGYHSVKLFSTAQHAKYRIVPSTLNLFFSTLSTTKGG